MNKSYRSIWNESLGAWVAASETTKTRGKKSNSRKVTAVLLSLLGVAMVPGAFANTLITAQTCVTGSSGVVGRTNPGTTNSNPSDGSGTYSVIAGCQSSGNLQTAATVYGAFAQVTGTGGTAIGFLGLAGKWASALGLEANATGTAATALGFGSNATALNAVAIGSAGGNGTTPLSVADSTTASGAGSIAIGSNAIRGAQAAATDSIALGGQSSVTAAGTSGIAVGRAATVSGANGLAAGSGATASGSNDVALGSAALASGGLSFAGGVNSRATGASSIAIGPSANAGGARSLAMGSGSAAAGNNSIALGSMNTGSGSTGSETIAIGWQAGRDVTANLNIALGANAGNTVSGTRNVAVGYSAGNNVTASYTVSLGDFAHANATMATAIGTNTQANGMNAVVVGTGSNAGGVDSVVVGAYAAASADRSIAIGRSARADGMQSISIGTANVVSGNNSGALGDPSYVTGAGTYTIGNNNGTAADPIAADNAGVFGNGNLMDAVADNSRIVGNGNSTDSANTMIVGNNVSIGTGLNGAVVLGNNSTVAAAVDTPSTTINGTTYTFAGGAPADGDVVSVGSATVPRQIQNVAAGRISATSTDAINGSQLYATNQAVTALDGRVDTLGASTATNLGGSSAYDPVTGAVSAPSYTVNGSTYNNVGSALSAATAHYYSVNDGGVTSGNYQNDGATGNRALAAGVNAKAIGARGVAIGSNARATGDNALAAGNAAEAVGNDGVSIGSNAGRAAIDGGSSVSIGSGAGSNANGHWNVAIGPQNAGAQVVGNGNVSLGQAANYRTQGSWNTGTGSYAGNNSSGSYNAYNGFYAGAHANGSNNAATGATAGYWVEGDGNVASGVRAGNGIIGSNNVSVGNGAGTANTFAVQTDAFGNIISASGGIVANETVAIGNAAVATRDRAIAIGAGAQANGAQSISIGTGNIVNGANSGAFGDPNTINGSGSYAVGNNNTISANNAFVVGNNVTVDTGLEGAVVLGNASTVSAAVDTPSTTINGTTYTFAGGAPADGDVVSVGSAAAPRQIQNVAAGRISNTSTDAINGSQLYGTNQAVTALDGRVDTLGASTATNLGGSSAYDPVTGAVSAPSYTVNGSTYNNVGSALAASTTHYYSVNDGGTKGGNYNNNGATGIRSLAAGVDATARGTDTISIGSGAEANTSGSISIGRLAGQGASGSFNVAVGELAGQSVRGVSNAAMGFGAGNTVTGDFNTATGTDAGSRTNGSYNTASGFLAGVMTNGDGNAAFGTFAGVATTGDSNVAIGTFAGTDPVTTAGVTASNSVSIGTKAYANADDAVALGNGSGVSQVGGVALGAAAIASAQAGDVALGSGSVTASVVGTASTDINGTTYKFSGTTPTSTVSVGAVGAERTITNLAAGRISGTSTDAINGSQLYGTNQALTALDGRVDTLGASTATNLGGSSVYDPVTGAVSAPSYTVNGSTYNNVGSAITAAGGGWNMSADGGTTSENIGPGETANFAAGSNAIASRSGNTITYGVVSNPTFAGMVTANGGLTVGAGQTVNMGNNVLTNVATGTADTDAANVGQMNTAVAGATASGLNFTGNDATAGNVHRNLGQTLAINGGATTTGSYSGSNLKTVTDPTTGAIRLQMADAPVFSGPVKANGFDANGNTITNVAAGSAPTDAVNYLQLQDAQAAATTHYYSVNDGGVSGGNYSNDGATGLNALAGGVGAKAADTGAVALGWNSNATSDRSVAIGASSTVRDGAAVALGSGTTASGLGTIAIGSNVEVDDGSIRDVVGIGRNMEIEGDSFDVVAMGRNIGGEALSRGIAIGSDISLQDGIANFIAMGAEAKVAVNGGIAIGARANAGAQEGDVALGSGSITAAVVATPGGAINGKPYEYAGAAPVSTVSVGAVGAERTITNVAAGRISGTSTDAINGSQLYATNQAIGTLGDTPLTFTGNAGAVDRKLGETLQITGAAGTAGSYSGANLKTEIVGNEVQIKMADAPVFASLSTTGGASIGGNLNVAGTTTTNNLTATGTATLSGPTVLSGGTTISSSLTVNPGTTVNMGSNVLTNVATGTADTDAANVGQMNTAVAGATASGLNFTGNDAAAGNVHRNLGQTLAINGGATTTGSYSGANLKTVTDPATGAIKLQMAEAPVFNSLSTTGGATIGGNLSVTGQTTLSGGLSMAGSTITNVGTAVNGTDAVNLNQVNTAVSGVSTSGLNFTGNDATAGNVHRNLGETLAINGAATTAGSYSGANLKTATDPATGAIKLQMADAPVFTSLSTTGGASIGGDLNVVGTTNLNGPTVLSGGTTISNSLNVASGTTVNMGGNTITNIGNAVSGTDAVNLNQLNQVSTVAGKGWNMQANGGTSDNIAPGDTMNVVNGSNTTVEYDPTTNQLKVGVVETPTFSSISTTGGATIGGNLSVAGTTTTNNLTATGTTMLSGGTTIGNSLTLNPATTVNMGGNVLTNVATGTAGTDAANVGQVNTAVAGATTSGLNFTGNDATAGNVHRNLGETLVINGTAITTGSYSGSNLKTVTDPTTGAINLQMADAPVFASLSTTGGASIGGDLSVAGTTTTNNLTATGTTNLSGPTNISGPTIMSGGTTISNNLTVAGGTTVNMGGNTITNVGTGTAATDAANVGQVNTAVSGVAASGLNFTGNDATAGNVHRDLGQTLAINGAATTAGSYSGANLKTVTDPTTGAINLQMADAPVFSSLSTTGGATIGGNLNVAGATSLNTLDVSGLTNLSGGTVIGNSLTVASGSTVNMGGNTIANVGDAVSGTDAVNLNQLNQVGTVASKGWNMQANGGVADNIAPGDTMNVVNGSNTTVEYDPATNRLKVGVVEAPTFSSISTTGGASIGGNLSVAGTTTTNNLTATGATTLNTLAVSGQTTLSGGLSMAGNTVTNVGNAVNGTDAVNLNQVNTAVSGLNTSGLNFTGNDATAGNVHRDLGQTLAINGAATTAGSYSGANLKTVTDPATGAINLQMAEAPVFASLSTTGGATIGGDLNVAGATTLNTLNVSGATALSGPTALSGGTTISNSLTVAGGTTVNMGGNAITNVGNAVTGTDAVNLNQLNQVGTVAGRGWNMQANGGTSDNIAPGDTVNVVNGSNTTVEYDPTTNRLKVGVVDAPTFSSVTTNDLTVNNNATIGGSLNVMGPTSLSGGTTISGGLTLTANTTVNMGGNVITNVGAGTNPGDAVNRGQLNATNQNVANLDGRVNNIADSVTAMQGDITTIRDDVSALDGRVANVENTVNTINNGGGIRYFRHNVGDASMPDATADGKASLAVGSGARTTAAATQGVAMGINAEVAAANGTALGSNTSVRVEGGVALGEGSVASTAAGIKGYVPGSATTEQARAIEATTSTSGAVSVGDAANGQFRQITGVAAGTQDSDAVNVAQLQGVASAASNRWSTGNTAHYVAPQASGSESLATGSGASASGANSMASGNEAIASGANAVAVGNGAVSTGLSATALGQGATVSASNSVALGAGSVAVRGPQTGYAAAGLSVPQNSAGEVSVGSEGSERQLTNVAAGSAGTDAVNVNQLNGAMANINKAFNAVNQRIDNVEKDASAGSAGAMAMASMPQASIPGKSMMSAGVASYQGQTAIAIGVSQLSDNGRWVIKFNGSANSRGKVGVAVGAGFHW